MKNRKSSVKSILPNSLMLDNIGNKSKIAIDECRKLESLLTLLHTQAEIDANDSYSYALGLAIDQIQRIEEKIDKEIGIPLFRANLESK